LPARYFPVGPKADFHVPLSIVEAHPGGSRLEVGLAAPRGLSGAVVIDVGILEEAVGPEAVGPEAVGPEAVGPEAVGPEAVGPEAVGPEAVGPGAGT